MPFIWINVQCFALNSCHSGLMNFLLVVVMLFRVFFFLYIRFLDSHVVAFICCACVYMYSMYTNFVGLLGTV